MTKEKINSTPYKWLLSHTKSIRSQFTSVIGLSLLSVILFIIQAKLITHPNTASNYFLVWFISILLLRALVIYFTQKQKINLSINTKKNIRKNCIDKINLLGPVYAQQFSQGELTNILTSHIEAISKFYSEYYPNMMLVVLSPLIIFSFIFSNNWLLGLLLILTAPIIPIFMALIGIEAQKLNQKQFKSMARLGSLFLDRLQGMPTLKLLNYQKRDKKIIAESCDDFRMKTMGVLKVAFLSSTVLEFFSAISIALLAVYLGLGLLKHFNYGNYHHLINFKEAFFILLLAPEFYLAFRNFATSYHAKAEAVVAAEKIQGLLLTSELYATNKNKITINKIQNIAVKNITVLKNTNINFKLEQSGLILIQGPSGSGKTSLLNTLSGYIENSHGQIEINSINLKNINILDYRKRLIWVDRESLDENSKNRLSGGEAQLNAINTVLENKNNYDVILMDEPLAHCDSVTRINIINKIKILKHTKLIIIASHILGLEDSAESIVSLK